MPRAFFVVAPARYADETMLDVTPVHPEAPRYRASLVFLPGFWAGAPSWRPASTYLGHRGWEGAIFDLRGQPGGLAARGERVAAHVRGAATPPVVVGHDAGALVALGVAARVRVAALVLVAPLVPDLPAVHEYLWSWRLVWTLLFGDAVPPPRGELADRVFAELPAAQREGLGAEHPKGLSEVVRGGGLVVPEHLPPTLVVHGDVDPLLPPASARAFAARLGADVHELAHAGRWPMVAGPWQACVSAVHRWLVQRLGEPVLDLYGEAMAERDSDDG